MFNIIESPKNKLTNKEKRLIIKNYRNTKSYFNEPNKIYYVNFVIKYLFLIEIS